MPSDSPISLRRLIVEPSSASVRLAATVLRSSLGGAAVVAVLDGDLLGDELLLEEHRADTDRQDRQPERHAVQRCGQGVQEVALGRRTACTPTARTGRPAAAPGPRSRRAEARTPPRARRASRPWCPRPASGPPCRRSRRRRACRRARASSLARHRRPSSVVGRARVVAVVTHARAPIHRAAPMTADHSDDPDRPCPPTSGRSRRGRSRRGSASRAAIRT